MRLTKLTPNIFYSDIKDGLELFVDCLGCRISYDDLQSSEPFCVVQKDDIKACLIQSDEFAKKDRPEIRIETDDIESIYKDVKEKHAHLLHPNSKEITLKPWGAKEFAILDKSGVCVIMQQWQG